MLVPVIPVEKPKTPQEDLKLPDNTNCFLIGKNGIYHQVKNDFYHVITKVDGPSGLAEIKELQQLKVAKMDLSLFKKAEAFLTAAWKQHDGEAVVLLAYSIEKKQWNVIVPEQKATGSHVEYKCDNLDLGEGFQLFGTIHTHPTFSAFHSGTDDKDEYNFDGLHITIGFVNRPQREYAVRWILSGTAFPCDLANAVEGAKEEEFDKSWLSKIEKKQYGGYGGGYTGGNTGSNAITQSDYYKDRFAANGASTNPIKKEDKEKLIRIAAPLLDLPAQDLTDEHFDLLNVVCADIAFVQEVMAFDYKKDQQEQAEKKIKEEQEAKSKTTEVIVTDPNKKVDEVREEEALQKAADFQDTLQGKLEKEVASGNVSTVTTHTTSEAPHEAAVRTKGGVDDINAAQHPMARLPKNRFKRISK